MKGYKEFNINDNILVKLNEKGFIHLKQYNDKYYEKSLEYYKSKADSDGYVEFIIWEFMNIFGPVMSIGFDTYFETTVLIKETDLK